MIVPDCRRERAGDHVEQVVLPAPFGPISPVIEPRSTDSEQLSTASRLPKRLLTLWTSMMFGIAARSPGRL